MKIAVPREVHAGERRVATTPSAARQLMKLGFEVAIEAGAGAAARFGDDAYREVGVEVIDDTRALWAAGDIVLKVRPPEEHPSLGAHEAELLREGATLVSFLWPAQNEALVERLAARKVTVLAMDAVPRISRAQKLDALSSMANIAGYRAVVEAAHAFGRFFGGQITAAGKIPPAKVLVIGAGVAGLSAIGAARSLGAIVRAFDTRPEVREQVESLDAEFLDVGVPMYEEASSSTGYAREVSKEFLDAEMRLFAEQAAEVDVIITTALIPGRPAPRLITADMVRAMHEGSVIVDLAAEQGGNCELTEPDAAVEREGVTVIGYTDLPSRLATQASELYATNLRHLLSELCPERNGEIAIDMDDVMIRGMTVVHAGEVTWPPPEITVSAAPARPAAPPPPPAPEETRRRPWWVSALTLLVGGVAFWFIGQHAPPAFMEHFTVFVLACFVGYQVIWSVTPALHTPLMSVTNAISGIIVIGALLQISQPELNLIKVLAVVSVLIASINIFGGFLVTQRMLRMFRK